jgi:hypothetical protein
MAVVKVAMKAVVKAVLKVETTVGLLKDDKKRERRGKEEREGGTEWLRL